MSIDGSSHTFSSVTVDGDGRAHLGDIYTFQYSAYNAREAVYQNTLSTTIRNVLTSKDLQRALLVVIDIDRVALPHDERSRMLEELETLLSRLQEMEQRGLSDNGGARLDFLEAAESDFKTSEYKKAVGKTLRRIETLARKTCTSSHSDICLDELCGLVERMSKQISARLCVAQAISGLEGNDGHQKGMASERTPLLLSTGARQTGAPVDAAEYVYASQDFWRQLALVLKEVIVKEHVKPGGSNEILGVLILFVMGAVMVLTLMIVMTVTGAPEEGRREFSSAMFIFISIPCACILTLLILLRSCGYRPASSSSETGAHQSGVVGGTV